MKEAALSSSYSQTGREFGLFVDLSYSIGDFNMNPSLGVTLEMEEVPLDQIHVMLITVALNILED